MSITPYTQPATLERIQTPQEIAVAQLAEWAHSADAAHKIAETLVQTSFCPDSFKGKAGEATAAILAGLEVGLQPMASLRSFDIIQGQAAPRAATLRAIVQAQGHEVELVESTATRCKMRGRRRGASGWQEVLWTTDRARDLGVTGKSNWKSQPQAMLVARATSEICRLVASDAILGIGYSVEEITDDGRVDQLPAEVTAPVANGTRRLTRKRTETPPADQQAPEQGTAAEGTPHLAPEDDTPTESPLLDTSSALAKAMYATIRDAGIPEDERLSSVSEIIGRTITSTKEMTEAEARHTTDHLRALLPTSPE
jgi:hypothetical protein